MDKTKVVNPNVSVGEVIVLTKAMNGQRNWEGIPLKVVSMSGNGNFVVERADGKTTARTNIYNTHPSDEYTYADRPTRLKFLAEKIKETDKELKELKHKEMLLKKFKTDDEEMAYIVESLFKAKGIAAKEEVLKLLKENKLV